MNKARAMLDALMGPGRDQAKDANSTDWKDRSVCRGYLVGFCPCDKGVLGGKRTLDVCPKIHSDPLRSKFEEHPDSGENSDFRIRCEEICLRDCEWAILECETHSKKELERLKREPKPRRLPPEVNQKISATKREIDQLKLKAEALDDCDAKQKENLLKQAQTMADDIEAYQKAEETKAIDALPKGATCDLCGTAYTGDEEYQKHLGYKVHEGYIAVREQITMLRQKKEARLELEKNGKDEDRKRKNEEAISKDENGKKTDDEKKDKDKGKDKKDSEKDRSKSRDDKKKDKKASEKERSRSRDDKKKDRKSSKDRSRSRNDKKKAKEKSKRSRSRDSMGRVRDREKAKAKGKDQSRSRSKGKSRDRGKDKDRDADKKKEKGRSRSRSRDRGKDKDRDKKRSRSRSKRRSRSRSRRRR